MSKLVIFRVENGNFDQGFPVNLEIRENGTLCVREEVGFLVPAPEIPNRYTEWQQAYYAWGEDENCRWWGRSNLLNNQVNPQNSLRQIKVPSVINSNYASENSGERARNAANNLEKALNDWLDRSSLDDIKATLLQTVRGDETVRFIVQSNNLELQKLPWKLWRLLERWYGDCEVALSTRKAPKKGLLSLPVKIIVILGSDENIDIKTDWNLIQDKLPTAELTLLKKTQSDELREKLIKQPWDVIFFAGHSSTEPGGADARIWINEQDYLVIQQLKTALEAAVKNGLKLAIFNSCDGLGLARQLENLQIPHIIVMREPIHDEVAQKFLDYFLTSFAKGASLHQAVHEARDKLRLLESRSPNASWLPVIFQNPEEPLIYYPIQEEEKLNSSLQTVTPGKRRKLARWVMGVGVSALIPLAFVIYKGIELLKDSTLAPGISLGEEILSEKNSTSEKQAGAKAFENKDYLKASENFKASLHKIPNDPEARIYFNNAKAADNSKQTIKIAVSVPLGSNQPIAEEILRGCAEVQEEINRDSGINNKPLQVVIANDNNDRDLAKKIAEKFVKDTTIFAVVGHNASNASVAAAPIYKNGKLVMISPTSFANGLGEDAYVFRMVPQITYFAAQVSKSISREIFKPKVFICLDPKSPDNQFFENQFRQVISANGGQYIDLPCNPSDPKFKLTTVAQLIRKNNANSLLVAPYVDNLPKAISIFKAVRENQLPIKLYGSPTLYTGETIKLGREAVEGLTLSVPYYPDAKEQYSFRERWKAEINTWRSPLAKDATKAIVTGLQQLLQEQQPTRQELDNILRDPNFKVKGVTGEFKFNRNTGEHEFLFQKERSDALIQIQGGKFVKLE